MSTTMSPRQFLEHIKMQKAIFLLARAHASKEDGGDDLFSYQTMDGGLQFLIAKDMIEKADQLCGEAYLFAEKRNHGEAGAV